jgi:hypothetical protein
MTELFKTSAPWLHAGVATPPDVDDLVRSLVHRHAQSAVRKLRGEKMLTREALWDECAAALQFPSYFGHNWDAFDECLNDLGWLNANAYVLVFSATERVLSKDEHDFSILIKILNQCGLSWSRGQSEQGRPAAPFHCLFAASTREQLTTFERRVHASHPDRSILQYIQLGAH